MSVSIGGGVSSVNVLSTLGATSVLQAGGGSSVIYRQITPTINQSTVGNTLVPLRLNRCLVPKQRLSKNGDVVRLYWTLSKNGVTDNAFVLFYVGLNGETSDTAVNSASTTALSGATDTAASYIEFMRVGATTLKRRFGGALVTNPVGNSSADIPANFTVPNMDTNDLYFTVASYTATAGGAISAEIATLNDFEVECRPFPSVVS